MLPSTLGKTAQLRWVVPVLVAAAVAAVVINETTYRRARSTLDGGIALTDARLGAMATLQQLTDAEKFAHAVLLHQDPADARAFEEARRAVQQHQDSALRLVAQVDTHGEVPVSAVRSLIEQRLQTLSGWVQRAQDGRLREVLAESARRDLNMAEIRTAFDAVLSGAASLQTRTRVSLYDALQLNRLAMHLLVLVAAAALYAVMRQLRGAERFKALQQRRLEEQIVERTGELRELARHLVHAREDERARVARELHDEMGGMLTAVKLEFARLRRLPGLPEEALPRLSSIDARLSEGIALKRRIIEHLRPSALDQLGLKTSLEMLCTDVASVLGRPVHADIADLPLAKDVALTLYRVVQESLTNVCKYAEASTVSVALQAGGDAARLTIRDDGRGFDPSAVEHGRHGLLGMRVRLESHGGRLRVSSRPGAGTEVIGEVPLRLPQPAAEVAVPQSG